MRITALILFLGLASLCMGQTLAEDYDSTRAYEASLIAPDSLQEELFKTYADAVGNWSELADFVESYEGDRLLDAIWLVNHMPHLDRLLATTGILKEHIDYSYKVRENAPWQIPDSMFLPYLVSYRISYEPVTFWRKMFYEEFFQICSVKGSASEASRYINSWINDNIDTTKREFFGGMQSPDLTFIRKKGNQSEISALTTAILMAVGIPSRNAMIRVNRNYTDNMSWVEIFDSKTEKWLPLYPDNPDEFGNFDYPEELYPGGVTTVLVSGGFDMNLVTENYSKTGFARLSFFRGGKPASDWKHFSINARSGGAYWPLDEIGAQADSNGIFEIELGIGEYLVECGYRENTGSVWFQSFPLIISENETTSLSINIDAPQYIDNSNLESGSFPVFSISDLSGNIFSSNQIENKKPLILFFFDQMEPSVRSIDKLKSVFQEYSDSIRFKAIWVDKEDKNLQLEDFGVKIYVDNQGKLFSSIIENDDKLEEELPLFLFNSGENLVYEKVSQGYDLNIENIIKTKIENCGK